MNLVVVKAVVAVLAAIAALYLSFELGRLQSGYSVLDNRRQTEAFSEAIGERDFRIEELEREVARLETSRDIDSETYANIESNLTELQERIQQQEEDLAFYQGIVSPGDGVAGLRIQNVEIGAGEGEATHVLGVLLVQAIVHNDRVTGSVRATVAGTLAGEPVSYGLDELGAESQATDIPYAFRYFQNLQVGLALPDGFEPENIEVQVWPRSPRGETIVQSFPWPEAQR